MGHTEKVELGAFLSVGADGHSSVNSKNDVNMLSNMRGNVRNQKQTFVQDFFSQDVFAFLGQLLYVNHLHKSLKYLELVKQYSVFGNELLYLNIFILVKIHKSLGGWGKKGV